MSLLLAAFALFSAAAPASFGQAPPSGLEELRERSEALRRDMENRAAEAERTLREEEELLRRVEEAERTLALHRRHAARLRAELEELAQQAALTREARADLAQRTRAAAAAAGSRLAALYKVHRRGGLAAAAVAETPVEILRRRQALKRLLAQDEEMLRQFTAYAAELAELDDRLTQAEERHRQRREEYDRLVQAAGRERSARERLLAEIRDRRAVQLAALERLAGAARELDREIASLARPGSRRPPAPGERPFSAMKGLLPPPVAGRITHLFGPYKLPGAKAAGFRSGIDIAADRGEPVASVHAGRVVFAREFKGYGQLVIIDHGEHYYSVYGHLEEIFTAEERQVAAGEVIATVGDSAALEGPALHFELRHHGKPLDPSEWLVRAR